MRRLDLNGDVYDLPGSWNELTTEQLVFLINLSGKPMTAEEMKVKLLLFCMNAHVRHYRVSGRQYRYTILAPKRKKYDLSAEEMFVVADIFSYLFVRDGDSLSISPLLTRNHFPQTQCGCRTVYGPGDGLQDINYGQFVLLLTYFQQMQQDPDAIHDLLAVIYKTKGDESSRDMMRKMSGTVKTATLWFFLGSLQFMAEKFPLTFSGGEASGGSVFESQMRVIDALASNDVTKKEVVKTSLLYDALYSMEISAEMREKK